MIKHITRTIAKELNIAYVQTDLDLRIIEFCMPIPGYGKLNPADYVGSPITEMFQELIGYEDVLQGIVAGRVPRLDLERINREVADGGIIYIDFTDLPLHDRDGNIVGLIHLVKDVTRLGVLMQHAIHRGNEMSLLHAELNERNKQLELANAELRNFAHVVSHDLREPLRTIRNHLGLLQRRYKGKLDADADDFIEFAVNGAARMENLIKGLLKLARVSTNGRNFTVTDSAAVLHRVLSSLSVMISEHDAVVTHDPLPTVLADELQLEQLFLNLISNALKFQPEQSTPRVHISAEQAGAEWLFSVKDNGIGIAPSDAERIFGIFQQLNPRTRYAGTGIGLAICKKVVERHDGRIWVESQPGKGATFYFTLPVK